MVRRRLSLAGRLCLSAVPGMLAGHALVYRLLFPSAAHRHRYLELTGHGYLRWALLAGVAGGAGAALGALRAGWRERSCEATQLKSLVAALAGVQVGGFVGLEVVERIAAHAPLADLWLVLGAGLAVQVVVAVLGGLWVGGVERLGRGVAPSAARPLPRPVVVGGAATPPRRRLAGIELPALRAPPAPAGL